MKNKTRLKTHKEIEMEIAKKEYEIKKLEIELNYLNDIKIENKIGFKLD